MTTVYFIKVTFGDSHRFYFKALNGRHPDDKGLTIILGVPNDDEFLSYVEFSAYYPHPQLLMVTLADRTITDEVENEKIIRLLEENLWKADAMGMQFEVSVPDVTFPNN